MTRNEDTAHKKNKTKRINTTLNKEKNNTQGKWKKI
jgi:hypothetical protein